MTRHMGTKRPASHYQRWVGRLASLALIALAAALGRPAMATETVTLYVVNAQGSVVATMTPQGQVTYTAAYRPYGKKAQGSPQAGPGYTGHMMDPASGLVYMQQRYYNPEVGRFISPDPVAPVPGDVFTFGRYTYANDNPLLFIDPDGRRGKVAWLVRLAAKGMTKVARLTREQAIEARRAGKNIVADRRQISNGIERAAHGSEGRLKHAGHELKDGSKGLPHYQTKGTTGHSFWGKVSVAAASVAGALNQAAEAAEYIPDPTPKPATQDDIDRTNKIIHSISDFTGLPLPTYPDIPEGRPLPFPDPAERDRE